VTARRPISQSNSPSYGTPFGQVWVRRFERPSSTFGLLLCLIRILLSIWSLAGRYAVLVGLLRIPGAIPTGSDDTLEYTIPRPTSGPNNVADTNCGTKLRGAGSRHIPDGRGASAHTKVHEKPSLDRVTSPIDEPAKCELKYVTWWSAANARTFILDACAASASAQKIEFRLGC